MKGFFLAGAVAALLAAPVFGQTPEPNPSPSAAPAPIGAPERPGDSGDQDNGGPWMRGRGAGAMRGGPMMHREMWRNWAMRANPQQRCVDRLAHRAAHRAYVETELNLTPQQQPLWDKLQGIAQSEQQKERQLCSQLKPESELTMLDRMDRVQRFLTARLDALQAAKPAVQALYQSLTPEQKAIFDHPFRGD